MVRHRNRMCRVCKTRPVDKGRTDFCGPGCRRVSMQQSGRKNDRGQDMSAGEVDRLISQAVALETAPPWIRHPVPQTGVVYRRAGT